MEQLNGLTKPQSGDTAKGDTLGKWKELKSALNASTNHFVVPSGLGHLKIHLGLQPLRGFRPGLCCSALSALEPILRFV